MQTGYVPLEFFYIVIIIIIVLLAAFFYQGRRRQRNAPYISLAIILGLVGQTLFFFPAPLLQIGFALITWCFISIYLHFESLASLRPNQWFFGIVVGFGIASTIFSFLFLFQLDIDTEAILLVQRFIGSIASILAMARSLQIVISIHKQASRKETKIELIGVSLLLTYRITFFVFVCMMIAALSVDMTPFLFIQDFLVTTSLGLVIVGLFLVILNYTFHPDYIYRLPFPVHSFMIYNEAGISLYNRRVQAQMEDDYQDMLMSGALTAISQLVQETLGSGARLRHVDADNYKIFLESIGEGKGTLVVIATGGTAAFRRSLQRFIRTIPDSIINALNDLDFDVAGKQKTIDELLFTSFPYLEIPK